MNNPVAHMREHLTPIPTPLWVRLGTSILFGAAVAALASRLSLPMAIGSALLFLIAGFVLVFADPYRREMHEFADRHNVTMLPTIGQLVPLMLLWFVVMCAPLFTLPAWGALIVWAVVFGVSFFVFPHVDGSRKLAFA